MFAEYLTRGVKAGLVAGLVFGLFMAVVANPLVGYADELNHAAVEESGHAHEAESAHSHGTDGSHSHDSEGTHASESGGHHDTAVSMAVTKAVSVAAGGLWGVVLGGAFFGVAFFFLEPAIPGPDAAKSYLMGLAGFVTVSGAPWLVLPPVAPGAEQSLSVATRLPLYAGMMLAGALACLSAGYAYTRLRESSGLAAALVGAAVPFGLLAVLAVFAPENAVHGALSPTLETGLTGLFAFGQVLQWLVLAAAHSRLRPSSESEPEPAIPTAGRDSAPAAD
ncbi:MULTISPECIES: CbtA family protein [Haloferax]|uniref:Putative cobalt transporter subunit (CbtA) n=1 Tax=Haloferax massiliensis TaxID=1476858 RepID=A0A0D6JUX8_9EURY|nr:MULTISPECIES: CbtA family protein [Haloferax]MDS0241559.1 CbtA family protein [Haloferax sp. S2CR25]MDS0444680.1 CbtA family protein [Haloferax sp. S2CR25-2]CQR51859.1 putative cobalt transporter subunit (CbtA) [Haloferax massiliensis]